MKRTWKRIALVSVAAAFAACATPMEKAAYNGNDEEVASLLAGGADVNQGGVLYSAVRGMHPTTVKLLLAKGASPNAVGILMCPGNFQSRGVKALAVIGLASANDVPQRAPVLTIATQLNDLETAKLLLEAGANPDGQVEVTMGYPCNGYTSLMIAARQGNAELIKLLLKHKASLDIRSGRGNGKTAGEWAEADGQSLIAQLLSGGR